MLDQLQFLSSKINVTGSESDLTQAIASLLLPSSAPCEFNLLHSLTIPASTLDPRKIMVSLGVDVSGLICLNRENNRISLAQTGNYSLKDLKGMELLSSKGEKLIIPEDITDEKSIDFESSQVEFGDTLKPTSTFREENGMLVGRFSSRYLLLQAVIQNVLKNKNRRFITHFSAQQESRAESEKNATLQYQPKASVLINSVESNSSHILLAVREGKHFSDESLVQLVMESGVETERICLDSAVTKSASLSSCNGYTPTITLLLPTKNKNQREETASIPLCSSMIQIVNYLAEHI